MILLLHLVMALDFSPKEFVHVPRNPNLKWIWTGGAAPTVICKKLSQQCYRDFHLVNFPLLVNSLLLSNRDSFEHRNIPTTVKKIKHLTENSERMQFEVQINKTKKTLIS